MSTMNNKTQCPSEVTIKHVIGDDYRLVIILAGAGVALTVYTVLFNFIILAALCLRHRYANSFQETGLLLRQFLMGSLATADMLIGLVLMPGGVYALMNHGDMDLGPRFCQAFIWCNKVLCAVSIYHVVDIAFVRYLAVCRPFIYRELSKRFFCLLISFSWALPPLYSLALFYLEYHHVGMETLVRCLDNVGRCTPIYNTPFLILYTVLDFYIPFLIIIILYLFIAKKVHSLNSESGFASVTQSQFSVVYEPTDKAETDLKPSVMMTIYSDHSASGCMHESPEKDVRPGVENPQSLRSFQVTVPLDPKAVAFDTSSSVDVENTSNTVAGKFSVSGARLKSSTLVPQRDFLTLLDEDSWLRPFAQPLEPLFRMMSTLRFSATTSIKSSTASRKVFTSIGCLVLCFLVCWLPYSVYFFAVQYRRLELSFLPLFWLNWLGYLNSGLTPLFYLLNPPIRFSIMALFNRGAYRNSVFYDM